MFQFCIKMTFGNLVTFFRVSDFLFFRPPTQEGTTSTSYRSSISNSRLGSKARLCFWAFIADNYFLEWIIIIFVAVVPITLSTACAWKSSIWNYHQVLHSKIKPALSRPSNLELMRAHCSWTSDRCWPPCFPRTIVGRIVWQVAGHTFSHAIRLTWVIRKK